MKREDQLIELFCNIDDYCLKFEPEWNKHLLNAQKRNRSSRTALSEIMTITIHFHQSGCRTFKRYFTVFSKKETLFEPGKRRAETDRGIMPGLSRIRVENIKKRLNKLLSIVVKIIIYLHLI